MPSVDNERKNRRWIWLALSVIAVVQAWLLWWPTRLQPRAWNPPSDNGFVGVFTPNHKLASLRRVTLEPGQIGPEHLAAHQGAIYAGLVNGDIVRVDASTLQSSVVLNTGGRPLGMDFDANGRLVVADPLKGLLRVTGAGARAQVETLLTRLIAPTPEDVDVDVNSVKIAADGTIWVTEASHRFGAKSMPSTFEGSMFDTLEHSCTGRLIRVAPDTLASQVMLQGLCFANGLAMSNDGRKLLLSETGNYRILQIDLDRLQRLNQGTQIPPSCKAALSQGAVRVLIDNLPGFPDNLMRGERGRIWVGLTKPRSTLSDLFAAYPQLRKVMARLPTSMWPVPKPYGIVFAFDDQGHVLDVLQDPDGAYPDTTSATEINGRLFVQSLHAHAIGWMPYAGLTTP